MNHLFISYSRKDEELVSAVVQRLRAQGLNVWQDISGKTSGIPYSTKWFAAIEEALYTSAGAVMFCSEAWRKSVPCQKEQQLITELAIPPLPIELEEGQQADPEEIAERIVAWSRESVYGQETNEQRAWLLSSVHACSMQKGRYTGIPRYRKRRESKAFLSRLEQSGEVVEQLGFAEKAPGLYAEIQHFLKKARRITTWDYWKKPLAILLVVAILGGVAYVAESYRVQKIHADNSIAALQTMGRTNAAADYDEVKALTFMARDEYDYSEYSTLLFERYADVLNRAYPVAFHPAETEQAQAIAALPEQRIADGYGLEFDEVRGVVVVDFAAVQDDYRPAISLQLACAPDAYAYSDGYLALAAAQRVYVFDMERGYAPVELRYCFRDIAAMRIDSEGRICAITNAGDVYVWENPIERLVCEADRVPNSEAIHDAEGFKLTASSTGTLEVRDTVNDCIVWRCTDIAEPIDMAFLDAIDWTVYAQGRSGSWYAADASAVLADYSFDMAKQRENYLALGDQLMNRLVNELGIAPSYDKTPGVAY